MATIQITDAKRGKVLIQYLTHCQWSCENWGRLITAVKLDANHAETKKTLDELRKLDIEANCFQRPALNTGAVAALDQEERES